MSNLYNQQGNNNSNSNRYAPPPMSSSSSSINSYGVPSNQYAPPSQGINPSNIPPQYNQQQTQYNNAPPSQFNTPNYAPPGQNRPPMSTNQGYGPPPTFTQQPLQSQGPPTSFQSPPPVLSGPPSNGGGNMGNVGGIRPPPKSNVQFFSVGGGNTTPVPTPSTSFGAMPPPPSNTNINTNIPPPPMNNGLPPPPVMSGPPSDSQLPPSPGTQQSFQSYPPPPGQQQFVPPPGPGSGHGYPPQDVNTFGVGVGVGGVGGVGPSYNPMAGMPLGFDSGTYGQPQPGAPIDPNGTNTPQILPGIEEMDLSIQCDPSFLRASVGKIVNSQALASQSRVPLGIVCHPMAGDVGTENDLVEVVDFGSTGIVRCKRCRTYINPFVSWVDNGRRWRCNICGMLNDVPTSYFSHLDQNGQRRDKDQRPELSRCSVEFVAPGDYMVRPPQPPVYFFVIDVTSSASSSGMLRSCVNAIKKSLDNLPGSPRTQIGKYC